MKAYETHESSENYLESILMLSMDHHVVRSIDIANMLGFSKPSVAVAMKHLREEGQISVDQNGYIRLTKAGMEIARSTYEKHVLITNVLVELGVNAYTAGQDACRIEHVLSPESFTKIKESYLSSHNGKSDAIKAIEDFEKSYKTSDPE